MKLEQLRIWLEDSLRTFVPMRFDAVRRRYDDGYAERTDRFAASTAWQAETERLLAAAGFRAGDTVLDCGCNTGRLVEPLERLAGEFRYLGVDVNDAAIRRCRVKFGAVHRFELYDGKRLPLDGGTVDIVILNHSIGHVEDPETTLREALRVLRPGGAIAIATPNRGFKRGMILRNLVNGYRPDRTVLRYYAPDDLAESLRKVGFAAVRTWLGGEPAVSFLGKPVESTRSRLFAVARRAGAAAT